MTSHIKLFGTLVCKESLPKLEHNLVTPKEKGPKRKNSQVEGENGKSGEGGGGDRGHREVDQACGQVRRQEESQRVLWDSAVESRAENSKICQGFKRKRISHLRYKFGFGGVDDGADDFLSSLILKLSEAFLDLIDLEVFFGSWSSATYTRRRSRIAKPKAQNQKKILSKKDLGRVVSWPASKVRL